MGAYYLYSGLRIVQTGTCPDGEEELHSQDGLSLGMGEPPESLSWPSPREQDYTDLRRAAYPSVGQQLDALWKGGEALAAMQKQILAVKAAYPKPQEGARS